MCITSRPDDDRNCPPLIMNAADRRYLIPEVIQTSDMDCGPAALKALFEGFGISLSYGRLREACQTQVDGSSINTIEDVALKLGMNVEQTMLPVDHLPLPEAAALPALLVVTLPNGFTHFVVLWRMQGPFAQVMDPSQGRRWVKWDEFAKEIFIHQYPISAQMWRDWAGENEFLGPLRHRMGRIGIAETLQNQLIDAALADQSWRGLAALDAKVRMVKAMIKAKGLHEGKEASTLLQSFTATDLDIIPNSYWSVSALPPAEAEQPEQVLLRGAVLLRILGVGNIESDEPEDALPPELEAALNEKPERPLQALWQTLRQDSLFIYIILGLATLLAAIGLTIEMVFLQMVSQIGNLALRW